MASETVGFWSYVQQDNEGDHGRILALANDLREQYRLLTAENLELFVDRESLQWGEAWKDRIDSAIAGTTFFIPIITPSYFRSPECRREVLKFAREAERLGLGELLMSVYWVRVPELEDDPEQSADEAVRLVAKYNWQNLQKERLEDRDSSAYRKAVAELAAELVNRAEMARQVEDAPVAVTDEGAIQELKNDDGRGVIERLAAGEDAAPKVVVLLQGIGKHLEEINERLQRANTDLQAANKRGQGMKGALTITNRLAGEMSQPAENIAVSGHEYGQVLAEVNASVDTQLDFIEELNERISEHSDFLKALVELEGAAMQGQEGLEEMLSSAEPIAALSRSLRTPIESMRSGLRGVLDGNAVISEWAQRAIKLLGETPPAKRDQE